MICIIEPQCINWQHEEVNAGMVKLIRECFPKEILIFVSDRGHWECIQNILDEEIVCGIKYVELVVGEKIKQNRSTAHHFYNIIRDIFELNEYKITKLILLSSHRGNMRTVEWLAREFSNIRFIVVVHAIMEELLKTRTLKDIYLRGVLKKRIEKLAEFENVKFIIYSPLLSEQNGRLLTSKACDKFYFIHHPYVRKNNIIHKHMGMVRIGIIGACINEKALQIIDRVEENIRDCEYRFVTIRSKYNFKKKKSVVVISESGENISREKIQKEMETLDYILLPYDKYEYRISASGVLFDSISSEIPTIMLDSPLLMYYNKYNIGWNFTNIDDLVCFIENIVQSKNREETLSRRENIRNLIQIQEKHNKSMIMNILN